MSTEIPIWINNTIRWVSGVDKKTTCKDVIEVILGNDKNKDLDPKDFTIMERWRRVERPLDESSKILKVWSHWGDEKKEVRLCLRRNENEVDSGRGSPVGAGNVPSLRRKRHRSRGNGKPPWSYQETVHPRRLAKLGTFEKEELDLRELDHSDLLENEMKGFTYPVNLSRHSSHGEKIYFKKNDLENRRKSYKSYQCLGTGMLHSTLLSQGDECSKPTTSKCCSKRTSKQKVRNSENIEKLMKLILAQGATIQSQLQKLKEREEQIEHIEHETHRQRVEKNGRNYLLETYLGSLSEAEVPVMDEVDEEKGNDSGVHTEGGSDQMNINWDKTKRETETTKEQEKRISRHNSFKHIQRVSKQEKGKRSRSENRTKDTQDKEIEGNLKRTRSENILTDSCHEENAKENEENLVELTRIQSQVEMWEKVFKINKRLEKEEENLVRLHIKIKRVQSENMKLAKEHNELEDQAKSTDKHSLNTNSGFECKKVEKNLEILRSDLDQNSKEIYHNFTKLIEDDEVVEQKRNYLTKLMNDLERTEHEHSMLNEMVTMKDQQSLNQVEDIGLTLMVKGQEKAEKDHFWNHLDPAYVSTPEARITCSSSAEVNSETQRPESSQQKSKSVKISFEDEIQNSNVSLCGLDKVKEPFTVLPGAIKGILKNRNQSSNKIIESMDGLEKCSDGYSSNTNFKTEKQEQTNVGGAGTLFPHKCPISETPENPYEALSHSGSTTFKNTNHRECELNRKDLQVSKEEKYSHISKAEKIIGKELPGRTLVTTKAVIHNDTDSSTSSDTSGLCSMYSSSPTVEEPYVDTGYVLDTLV